MSSNAQNEGDRIESKPKKTKTKPIDLTSLGSFEVLLVDPPWQYEKPRAVYEHSQIERSYETMPLEAIKKMRVPAAKDSCLFLWVPPALLPWGLEVMSAWGFKYTTHAIWEKIAPRPGLGYYFEMRHEVLLFGKKGKFRAPSPRTRPKSVFHAATREHSRKPDSVYDMIERCYPELSRIELFARQGRVGWSSWGNEASKFGSAAASLTRYQAPEKKMKAATLGDYVPKPEPGKRSKR